MKFQAPCISDIPYLDSQVLFAFLFPSIHHTTLSLSCACLCRVLLFLTICLIPNSTGIIEKLLPAKSHLIHNSHCMSYLQEQGLFYFAIFLNNLEIAVVSTLYTLQPRVSVKLGTNLGATVYIIEGMRGEVKRKRHLFRMSLYLKILQKLKILVLIFVLKLVYLRAFWHYRDVGLRSLTDFLVYGQELKLGEPD